MKNIIIGVTGSIAAYRSADLISELKKEYKINVVMTKSATKFITPFTLQVLSENKVYLDLFSNESNKIDHIDLVNQADKLIIAPATANTISKLANGLCADLLSTMLIVANPQDIIIAPAMNTKMYENKIIKDNINKLKNLGVTFIDPKVALLASNEFGIGAMADITKIIDVVRTETQ